MDVALHNTSLEKLAFVKRTVRRDGTERASRGHCVDRGAEAGISSAGLIHPSLHPQAQDSIWCTAIPQVLVE